MKLKATKFNVFIIALALSLAIGGIYGHERYSQEAEFAARLAEGKFRHQASSLSPVDIALRDFYVISGFSLVILLVIAAAVARLRQGKPKDLKILAAVLTFSLMAGFIGSQMADRENAAYEAQKSAKQLAFEKDTRERQAKDTQHMSKVDEEFYLASSKVMVMAPASSIYTFSYISILFFIVIMTGIGLLSLGRYIWKRLLSVKQ